MWKDVRAKYRVIERFKNKYPIWKMCELFEVSRSGFYKWRKRAASQQRSELDQIIIECQVLAKQTYGYRRVWLWMKRNRSIIPRYRKVVVPSTHTAENHDFISSDQGSKSSTSKSLFRSARSGNMPSK